MNVILLLIGFAIEVAALVFFKNSEIADFSSLFYLFLLIHLVAVSVFSFGMYKSAIRYRLTSPINWVIVNFAMCFIFSIVAFITLSALLVFISRKKMWQKSDIYDDYEKYIFYDFKPGDRPLKTENLAEIVESELEISPLVDVLAEEDVRLRRGAINIMNRLPRKDAVKLLMTSLKDRSVENRFYAASELSRIETELNDNIVLAKKDVERTPESSAAHLSLANSYSEYYECGILDEITAGYYLDLALEEYYKVLAMEGEDIKVLNYLANLEIHKKEYDKALAKFKRVCEMDPDNVYANVGIIQIFYETGDIEKAIEYSRSIISKMPETKGPIREIIAYWAS